MITSELVHLAYKLFFGREPENALVVEDKLARIKNIEDLRHEFMNSIEYFDLRTYPHNFPKYGNIEITANQNEHLIKRIASQWENLATSEPYYGVLTYKDYEKVNYLSKKELDIFILSGLKSYEDFISILQIHHIELNENLHVLELGSGVGRITYWLARHFKKVSALDISKQYLEIARENLEARELRADFINIESYSTLEKTVPREIDVFFSIISLQHNPPPIQILILRNILQRVSNGGIAYFQTVVGINGYKFKISDYLNNQDAKFETHMLPMKEVISLLLQENFEILEIFRDEWQIDPNYHSYTFLARKHSKS
jgi:SAM-dependent methyltransferase